MLDNCPACQRYAFMQKHHYRPQRFYGETDHWVHLCSKCHVEIEEIIYYNETVYSTDRQKLTDEQYDLIMDHFYAQKQSELIEKSLHEPHRLLKAFMHGSRQGRIKNRLLLVLEI